MATEDEAAATRAAACRTCGQPRNSWCRARVRRHGGYTAPARRPHKARMDDWQAMKESRPGLGGTEREGRP